MSTAVLARPRLSALALGAVAACGFQPLALWPLTLVAVALLLELVARANSGKAAFLVGWLFGVAHFTVGDNWIATAFTYQANMPAWLGWVAVVLLSLYLAIYPALATWGAWRIACHTGGAGGAGRSVALAFAFAGCWIVSEWLRSWVFTGFAWNPLGIVLLGGFHTPGAALVAPWMGTYALSGLCVLLAAAVRAFALALRAGSFRRAIAALAGLAAVLVPAMTLPHGPQAEGTLPFTLVQPDVRQEFLDEPSRWEGQFQAAARLTVPRRAVDARLVLWPESGLPDYLRDGYPDYLYRQTTFAGDPALARARIGRVIGPGSLLLTGAVDLEIRDRRPIAARNVITAVDAAGRVRGSYAKAHLVPYGEYLPLRWLLEPLGASRLVAGTLDFWPGPGPRTVDFGQWGRAGMQICYEIVFSGQVVQRGNRPDYIFNPSNDGWFGSWGPPQHLAQARLRALEEGLPVLRATTTGISAVIDSGGVVRHFVPRHTAARIDGTVPPAHAPTLFARMGNALPLCWAMAFLLVSLVALRRAKR